MYRTNIPYFITNGQCTHAFKIVKRKTVDGGMYDIVEYNACMGYAWHRKSEKHKTLKEARNCLGLFISEATSQTEN